MIIGSWTVAWSVDDGKIEGVDVSGLGVALSAFTIDQETKCRAVIHIDERATPAQHDALLKLATGQLGGAFAELASGIGGLSSIERSPVRIDLHARAHCVQLYRRLVARRDQETERAAIERAVLDYVEGWFGGDPIRMERALHPELVKRSLEQDASGSDALRTISAESMIEATARGEGKNRRQEDLHIEIEVEDLLGELASVTVRTVVYTEYLHLARTPHGWKIVNDVWQPTPGPAH